MICIHVYVCVCVHVCLCVISIAIKLMVRTSEGTFSAVCFLKISFDLKRTAETQIVPKKPEGYKKMCLRNFETIVYGCYLSITVTLTMTTMI